MREDAPSIRALAALQNSDGGWGYHASPSWTEPTAMATLALSNSPSATALVSRSAAWLFRNQRPDGGWAPQPALRESSSVTSLGALALLRSGISSQAPTIRNAAAWLLGSTGAESNFLQTWRRKVLGLHPVGEGTAGWPWVPGSASWTAPTALAILALSSVFCASEGSPVEQRIRSGRSFLLARRCVDSGWNHGGTTINGEQASSYPETTGVALLAFPPRSPEINASLHRALEQLRTPGSLEGTCWLELGLRAHSVELPLTAVLRPRSNDVLQHSLSALVTAARNGERLWAL